MQRQQLKPLIDILAALALADGELDAQETNRILDLLVPFGLENEDRADLAARLEASAATSFDLQASVEALGELSNDERMQIMKLVEEIEEADGVIDLEEELFLQRLGRALGLDEETIAAMTIEISDHEPASPPPLPPTGGQTQD